MTEPIKVQIPESCAWCAKRKGNSTVVTKEQITINNPGLPSTTHYFSASLSQCPECGAFIKRIIPFDYIIGFIVNIGLIAAFIGAIFALRSGNIILAIILGFYAFYVIGEIMLIRKDYLKNFLMGLIINTFFNKYRPDGYLFNTGKCYQLMEDPKRSTKLWVLFYNTDYQAMFDQLNPEFAKNKYPTPPSLQ
jgi:hypothetical protein